jgi:hypothetical protein
MWSRGTGAIKPLTTQLRKLAERFTFSHFQTSPSQVPAPFHGNKRPMDWLPITSQRKRDICEIKSSIRRFQAISEIFHIPRAALLECGYEEDAVFVRVDETCESK